MNPMPFTIRKTGTRVPPPPTPVKYKEKHVMICGRKDKNSVLKTCRGGDYHNEEDHNDA